MFHGNAKGHCDACPDENPDPVAVYDPPVGFPEEHAKFLAVALYSRWREIKFQ